LSALRTFYSLMILNELAVLFTII